MSYIGKFYSFLDVFVTVTYPDDSTTTKLIEAPTARDPFKWGWDIVDGRQFYRDGNFQLRRRREYYQFVAELNYNFHRMEIQDFLRAKSIELKIPIWWGPATYYVPFSCVLDRSSVMNEAFGDIMGGVISERAEIAGTIPRAGDTLRFIGSDVFAWDEIGSEIYPFLPPFTPVAVDGDGVETPLIGLKYSDVIGSDLYLQQINASSISALPVGTVTVKVFAGLSFAAADVTILPFST